MKSETKRLKVVIVGGGFGGLSAAKKLAGKPVDVTLVDRKNHHTFQPLLYQVATSVLSAGEIASPLRHILHRAPNIEVILWWAIEARTVSGSNFGRTKTVPPLSKVGNMRAPAAWLREVDSSIRISVGSS